jgi:hypothetical protein
VTARPGASGATLPPMMPMSPTRESSSSSETPVVQLQKPILARR